MNIIIPFEKKDDIGNSLVEKGFAAEAAFFLMRHYGGKSDNLNVNIASKITEEFLLALLEISNELDLRTLKVQANQALVLIKDIDTQPIKSLRSFESAIAKYLAKDAIKGWLFKLESTGEYVPYVVTTIRFEIGDPSQGTESTVVIYLDANSPKSSNTRAMNRFSSLTIDFNLSSVKDKSIPQALALKNFYKETQELLDDYILATDLYFEYQPMFGKQFVGKGIVTPNDYSGRGKVQLDGKKRIKMVNDDQVLNRTMNTYTSYSFWEAKDVPKGVFEEIPYHPYIKMFDLENHVHYFVLANNLSPYVYNPAIGDNLILPEQQRDLIDILVEDMEVVVNDFVEGKSGGTSILCMGAPGLGKTLTAEIYSEIAKKPLYRVHSGQLGANPDTIEKNLSTILERAESWHAICLLDECDVYVRTRDNSMQHNAIVAAFLRKLEYFNGLLFMTTNRSGDVDDAIKSRCMAIINYEVPDSNSAKKIWRALSKQFEMPLEESVIEELILEYPKCSGRDIKELLKLANKFRTMKGKALDKETFRQCAIFRGIEHR